MQCVNNIKISNEAIQYTTFIFNKTTSGGPPTHPFLIFIFTDAQDWSPSSMKKKISKYYEQWYTVRTPAILKLYTQWSDSEWARSFSLVSRKQVN